MMHLYPHSIKLDTNLKTNTHQSSVSFCGVEENRTVTESKVNPDQCDDATDLWPDELEAQEGQKVRRRWRPVGPTRRPAVPAAPPCPRQEASTSLPAKRPPAERDVCSASKIRFVISIHCRTFFFFFFKNFFFFPRRCRKKVCPQLVGGVWPTPAWLIFNAADLEGGVSAAFHYRGHFKLTSHRRCISPLLSSSSPERRSLPVFDSSNYFHQLSVIASLEFW